MVSVGSVPAMSGGGPAALLTMMTPIAPAACAASALITNEHVPRSMSAILPAICAALVSALQASFAGATPSTARMTWPVTVDAPGAGPKSAVPNGFTPAMAAGAVTRSSMRGPSVSGAMVFTAVPSKLTLK